jgi:hypothetical protein
LPARSWCSPSFLFVPPVGLRPGGEAVIFLFFSGDAVFFLFFSGDAVLLFVQICYLVPTSI